MATEAISTHKEEFLQHLYVLSPITVKISREIPSCTMLFFSSCSSSFQKTLFSIIALEIFQNGVAGCQPIASLKAHAAVHNLQRFPAGEIMTSINQPF